MEKSDSRRNLQFISSIPQQDPNPIIGLTPTGEIIYSNPSGKKILKYWMELLHQIPDQMLMAAQKARLTNLVLREEIPVKNKTYLFTLVWVSGFNQVNIYGTDITQLKSTELNIINLGHFDALTRVANRQYFEAKFIQCLQENIINKQKLSILLIDLDNFKIVNDSLGHPMGDRLLQAATKRMLRCLRKQDFIARLGGDEFIILLSNTNSKGASAVAANLNQALVKPFEFGGYNMKISCSIGIAISPDAGNDTITLLKHADIAMYQAKKTGKNKAFIFSDKLHLTQYERELTIKKDLKFATSRDEFYIEYQPQISLEFNTIFGFEALLRWKHPKRGLILPNEFIPAAERSGLIHTIGQWIIEQAISDYTTWLEPYSKSNLSINISLPQLNDALFIDSLCTSLCQQNLNNEQLILDLSEHILTTHFAELPNILTTLHEKKIKLSLDNFGSPHIPFLALLEMPLDYLKFDHNLLHKIIERPKQQLVIKEIIHLTQKLGMEVIQKGIETKEQHVFLKSIGCLYGQGRYYCKPMRIQALISHLKKHPNLQYD